MRVFGRCPTLRVADTTTSPEGQLSADQELSNQRGHEEVGVAEDLDVSGAIVPSDRKNAANLARWRLVNRWTLTGSADRCRHGVWIASAIHPASNAN